jgi:hypothetical protein
MTFERVEFVHRSRAGAFASVDVGGLAEHDCGMVPGIAATSFGHPEQFTERKWTGIDSDDARKLVN